MAPKRASKDNDKYGGAAAKRSRVQNISEASARPKVSEGITERQLASFTEVSAAVTADARGILQAQNPLTCNPQTGINSLFAAQAAVQQNVNVFGDYKAALQLLHLQKGAVGHAFAPQHLGSAPPAGIPMPTGIVHDISGLGADAVRGLALDAVPSSALRGRTVGVSPMLQSAAGAGASVGVKPLRSTPFVGANAVNVVPTQLVANYMAESAASLVMNSEQLSGPLPSMMTLESHSKSTYPHAFVAINAVHVDAPPDHHGAGLGSGVPRSDIKVDCGAPRSHGPSADRYKNRWSEEEIVALKKGVTRFEKKNKKRTEESSSSSSTSLDTGKKGESEQMWEHILKSHKFQTCRTARDLKDKWRQLKKKEQDDLLGVREEARRLRMLAVGGGGSNSSSCQGNTNSGDNDSSTSSSNGEGSKRETESLTSADQPNKSMEDSPPGSSSPLAGMCSSCSGSTSSPAPNAQGAERSDRASDKTRKAGGKTGGGEEEMSTSPSPANACAPAPRAPSASKQQREQRNAQAARNKSGNSSENGSDNNSEASGNGAVGSESGGGEGGSEGSEGGSDERHNAGGSEHGEGSEGSEGGGKGQGSERSGDSSGNFAGFTDETGMTSMGHSSNSAGTSSHEGRSDSSHEGGSEGRGGEEGSSDGSEWGSNACEEKDRKRPRPFEQQQQQSSRSRMSRNGMMEGIDACDGCDGVAKQQGTAWALAIDLGTNSVRVNLVNKQGNTMHGVEGFRSVNMDASAKTFVAAEYMKIACQAVDDALTSLRACNESQNTCHEKHKSSSGGIYRDGVCSCGNCKPPVVVRVVGISCFAMSLVGVGEDGEAVTPVYTYADARNQAYAGELKRKLAEEGSLDFVERRTAPLQSCYAPALFARLRQAGDWGNRKIKLWTSLSALFLSKLTGKVQPMTYSEASCTGLLDHEELQWHQGLLNLLGIHHVTLTSLCDADELCKDGIISEYRQRWPELAKIGWARGISEAAALNIGTGCDSGSANRRRICLDMGNSHTNIRVCVPCKDRRIPRKPSGNGHKGPSFTGSPSSQDGSSRKSGTGPKLCDESSKMKDIDVPAGLCKYAVKRDVMLVGAGLPDGGGIYSWGTEQLAGGLEEMARLQAQASAMEADSHGLTVLPFFSGGSTFGQNPTTGTVTGMTLRTSRAGILRAIMESVALRLRGVFLSIASILSDDSYEVYASGDALFKSPLWQQILVDSLGVRIHFMSGEQFAAGKGAAILALRAIGEEANVQQKPDNIVNPVPASVSAMTMAFERQEALYNRMNPQTNRH